MRPTPVTSDECYCLNDDMDIVTAGLSCVFWREFGFIIVELGFYPTAAGVVEATAKAEDRLGGRKDELRIEFVMRGSFSGRLDFFERLEVFILKSCLYLAN